jgi:hypothetical protein
MQVARLIVDDENEDKFWEHGIVPEEVLSVLEQPFLTKRNLKGMRASHLLIGRDIHGRCLAIPVEPTHDPLTWRPVTAWYCKQSEETQLANAT